MTAHNECSAGTIDLVALADYLDRIEAQLIGADADLLIDEGTPPSVWAYRLRNAAQRSLGREVAKLMDKHGMPPAKPQFWKDLDALAAQPPAAPVEPCPYAIDGCVLEKQEVGPCLCANPVKCSSAEQHEEATLQICFDKVAKERDQFRAQIKELSRSTERYMRAVAALGKDSGYNKLTYFEAPILNMPTEEMKTEAHNRWLELNDAGIALTLALQPEGGK